LSRGWPLAASLDDEAKALRQTLVAGLPDLGALRTNLDAALAAMQDPLSSADGIRNAFTALNRELRTQGLPYYILPKTYVGDCDSFVEMPFKVQLLVSRLKILLGKTNPRHSECKTTALMVYRVSEQQDFEHLGQLLPMFQTTWMDRLPIAETALGMTYYGVFGSLILADNIRAYALVGIAPALDSRGQDLVMPMWLDGSWDLRNQVVDAYRIALDRVYRDRPEQRVALKRSAHPCSTTANMWSAPASATA